MLEQENQHSHVVLDELLDFVAGVFVLAELDGAFFKFVVESWWTEQDNSSGKQKKSKCHCCLAAPTATMLMMVRSNMQ